MPQDEMRTEMHAEISAVDGYDVDCSREDSQFIVATVPTHSSGDQLALAMAIATSGLGDSVYDALSEVSSDDGCTLSHITESEFGDDTEAEDGFTLVGPQVQQDSVPMREAVEPVQESQFDDGIADQLLNSHLSDLTEKPTQSLDASLLCQSIENQDESWFQRYMAKLSVAMKTVKDYVNTPEGLKILACLIAVAVALVTNSLLTTVMNRYTVSKTEPAKPTGIYTTSADSVKLQDASQTSVADLGNQPEPVLQPVGPFARLASSRAPNRPKSTPAPSALIPFSSPISSATRLAVAVTLQNPTVPPAEVGTFGQGSEKFYIDMNTDRITPLEARRINERSDRIGLCSKLSGSKQKFKIDADQATGLLSITPIFLTSVPRVVTVVISKDGKVLRRGLAQSPDYIVSWMPSILVPDQLYGNVQVLLVLETESSFQVKTVNLGRQVYNWPASPQRAAAVASGLVQRLTDALSIYVEPVCPHDVLKSRTESPPTAASSIENDGMKRVVVRAHNHALTLASSVRSHAYSSSSESRRRLSAMSSRVIQAPRRYREGFEAFVHRSSKSFHTAHRRVHKLKRRVEQCSATGRTCQRSIPA